MATDRRITWPDIYRESERTIYRIHGTPGVKSNILISVQQQITNSIVYIITNNIVDEMVSEVFNTIRLINFLGRNRCVYYGCRSNFGHRERNGRRSSGGNNDVQIVSTTQTRAFAVPTCSYRAVIRIVLALQYAEDVNAYLLNKTKGHFSYNQSFSLEKSHQRVTRQIERVE